MEKRRKRMKVLILGGSGAIYSETTRDKEKGVIAPEGCIDPEPFFAELAKRGIYIHEREETNQGRDSN